MDKVELKINTRYYGGLNLDSINSNIQRGLGQLGSSAQQEEDQKIPRIIALAFETRVTRNDWQQLSDYVTCLLGENPSLSAIAVLVWTPDGIPPPEEDGFWAWLRFRRTTPRVPSFIVYHNSGLQGVKLLPVGAFNDKWSLQISC